MKVEEVLVRGLLGVMHFFAIFAVGSTLYDNGLAWYVVLFWCLAVLFLGLIAGSFFRFFPRTWATFFIVATAGCAILAFVLQYHIIPICGDSVCSPGECRACSADCSANQCLNNVCEKTERCDTSLDCACGTGFACVPARENADGRGCIPVVCGDKACTAPETSESCCADCGCAEGFACTRRVCLFEEPRVTFQAYTAANALSATTLAGNPMLTDQSGTSRPLIGIVVGTTRNIYNVEVNFSLLGISSQNALGNLHPGQNVTAFFYLHPDERFLSVIHDTPTSIMVNITYYDAQREWHSVSRAIPFTVLGRSSGGQYSHILLFTTKDVTTQATTVKGIWDELRQNITIAEHQGVQFPLETLTKRTASRSDMAVLLYSAYWRAGLKPSIMQNKDGDFLRLRYTDGHVIIDPARVNVSFEQAVTTGPGFTLSDEMTRTGRNFTILSLNASYIPGASISTKTTVDRICSGELRVVAMHTISNNGEVAASICAHSDIKGEGIFDEKTACYTIEPHGSTIMRHSVTNRICTAVQADVTIENA